MRTFVVKKGKRTSLLLSAETDLKAKKADFGEVFKAVWDKAYECCRMISEYADPMNLHVRAMRECDNNSYYYWISYEIHFIDGDYEKLIEELEKQEEQNT
jgi:hypothetical protein